MILKKEKNKKEEINQKKNLRLLKIYKKKILKIIIILIMLSCLALVIYFLTKKNNITIDIMSEDISYVYGPNGNTTAKLNIGQNVKLKVITDDFYYKCYSSNKDVINFITDDIAVAKNKGNVEIYCKNKTEKSNKVEIIVGD